MQVHSQDLVMEKDCVAIDGEKTEPDEVVMISPTGQKESIEVNLRPDQPH